MTTKDRNCKSPFHWGCPESMILILDPIRSLPQQALLRDIHKKISWGKLDLQKNKQNSTAMKWCANFHMVRNSDERLTEYIAVSPFRGTLRNWKEWRNLNEIQQRKMEKPASSGEAYTSAGRGPLVRTMGFSGKNKQTKNKKGVCWFLVANILTMNEQCASEAKKAKVEHCQHVKTGDPFPSTGEVNLECSVQLWDPQNKRGT